MGVNILSFGVGLGEQIAFNFNEVQENISFLYKQQTTSESTFLQKQKNNYKNYTTQSQEFSTKNRSPCTFSVMEIAGGFCVVLIFASPPIMVGSAFQSAHPRRV